MNKGLRYWLIAATLIVVATLATIWATSNSLFPRFPWEPRLPPLHDINWDIELFYTIKTVFSTMNATLLVFLLLTYVSIYRKTRSEFTIGLMVFSAIFLLDVLASNPLVTWVFGFRPFGLGPFAMLPDLFTFVALTVLLYLSVKY